MIEKVMKAVKRNSKRRSVNITIGAVVGFLLSCTAVMGAAAVEIKNVDGNFGVTKDIEGNTFEDKIYTNNGEIAGEDIGISVTGRPTNRDLSIINNGSIEATTSGIYMESSMTGNITNNGTISGENGINLKEPQLTGDIINNGNIESNNGHGIHILGGTTTGDIVNNGIITTKSGYNLYLRGTLNVNVINKGMLINKSASEVAAIFFGELRKNVQNDGFISVVSDGASSGIRENLQANLYNTGVIETEGTGSEDSTGILVGGTPNIENTGAISSVNSGTGKSYGINITSDGTGGNIKNDGIINATSVSNMAYGIFNQSKTSDNNVINRGLITAAIDNLKNYPVGIYNSTTAEKVLNTGYINSINTGSGELTGRSYGSYGISSGSEGKIKEITNKGNINTRAKEEVKGIVLANTPIEGTSILNEGIVKGTEAARTRVIYITTSSSAETKITNLTNSGVLYGEKGVILFENKGGGSVNLEDGRNYGILAHKTGDILNATGGASLSFTEDDTPDANQIANYGLAFKDNDDGTYTLQNTVGENITDTEGRNIVNAQTITDVARDGAVTGTTSIEFGDLDSRESYILNGIDNTLKVNGKENILNNSIVNAYKTATVMENGAELTAEGTAFNSVDDDSPTISLTGNNTLNLSNESIVNGDMEINGGNNTLDMSESSVNGKMAATGDNNNLTIAESYLNDEMTITGDNNTLDMKKSSMNGKVAATGDNNNLTIADSGINDEIKINGNKNILTISGDNTFINGDMEAKGTDNTVKLAGKSTDGSSLNMFNNISGFEKMNITEGNVTFFENAEVTGVEKLTVAEETTLNLRLKKEGEPNGDGLQEGVHAFSGNGKMEMKGDGSGGTLQFITNGIGEGVWIDTSDMDIKNMVVKTNSVLDGFKFDDEGTGLTLKAADSLAGMNKSGDKVISSTENKIESKPDGGSGDDSNIGDSDDIFEHENFESIDGIYKGIYSSTEDNLNALRDLAMTDRNTEEFDDGMSKEEQLKNLQAYLNEIYTQSPYALSSELSRRSAGMFRDIVTENMFRPDLNKWMIMGGLTHIDGGTKDTYYGEVYQLDGKNSLNTEADMKLTGAYALGKYGYSENVALGVTVGGNRSEAELSKSKVKGNSGYIGAFAENYRGNLTLKAGAGIQYSEYDADRSTVGGHSYNDKYSDMTYDIYLNGRYSNPVGENLFLEPYATLSYTYVDQDGTDEGSKALAIKTDSKSFEYTSAEVGVDLKKVIPHEKGKSTLSAGVSYTRLLNGADSDKLTAKFDGGSDFDILVAGKNKHNLGLNAKYTLELESGVLFDVKGSYSFERDSHKDNARNRNKGEWMVGAGLGYKF